MTPLESPNLSYFRNQISGHSCLLKGTSNSQCIYKPYDPIEGHFYESISKNKDHPLSSFTPAYYGTFQFPKATLEEFASQICRPSSSQSDSEENSHEVDIQSHSPEEIHSPLSDSPPCSNNSRTEWFKNLFLNRFNESNTRFLKLEDLTSGIESPCMLDLKMGSIAYNPEKFAHQLSKMSNTTSSSLKFRVCGLQVKNPKTGIDYFRDKYWGRSLKSEAIHNALALFFYDGHAIRRNLLKQFIKLLKELIISIKSCVGFKFYSVSLLLTYDSSEDDEGFEESECMNVVQNKLKLRLIDFAKTTYSQSCSDVDTDLLTGIENLLKCFTYIQENPETKPVLS